ncbi:MAG TPA: citrate synthase [Alphaproteobacteria bacterium]|nr:citrate synthase [Alphaproteobacteria bacterium]HBC53237.1 citrate synthase [Alphaproteobacteria bacterium]
MHEEIYLTAKQAAAELSISLPTLYAYVSRGLIRSEPTPGGRSRRYRAEDVRQLKAKREPQGGELDKTAQQALHWGAPVLDSALTLIADGALYYRGVDATALARDASVEQVARLLWGVETADPFTAALLPDRNAAFRTTQQAVIDLTPLDQCLALLPVAAAGDETIFNETAAGRAATGGRILRLMAQIIGIAGTRAHALADDETPLPANAITTQPLHDYLARAWHLPTAAAADILRGALILCADHELNASAFTARCVAATRAHLYGVVIAGLTALQGPLHGGHSLRVAAFLEDAARSGDPEDYLLRRLRAGEKPPGFGHPLYPQGDPRAMQLFAMLRAVYPDFPQLQIVLTIRDLVTRTTGEKPNIDYALASIGFILGLPPSAGLSLFALGRTIGWIAHAIEQYQAPQLIRPRARYTGETPRIPA